MSEIERATRRSNRYLSTGEVIAALPVEAKPYACRVGAWVWIEFPTMPDKAIREALILLGFSWNHTRRAWQHACGRFMPCSPGDPRMKYGTAPIVDEATATAA